MVAEGDGVESGLEPLEGIGRMRATVDQVTHAEEPIAGGVEDDLAESTLEGSKAYVNIADNDVASARGTIARDDEEDRESCVGTLDHRHLRLPAATT